jgi:uncharacterized membrane protein YccC
MADHIEHACPRCGSLLHFEDKCPVAVEAVVDWSPIVDECDRLREENTELRADRDRLAAENERQTRYLALETDAHRISVDRLAEFRKVYRELRPLDSIFRPQKLLEDFAALRAVRDATPAFLGDPGNYPARLKLERAIAACSAPPAAAAVRSTTEERLLAMMTTIQRLNGLETATAELSETLDRLSRHIKGRPPKNQRHEMLAWECRLKGIEDKRDALMARIEELGKQ